MVNVPGTSFLLRVEIPSLGTYCLDQDTCFSSNSGEYIHQRKSVMRRTPKFKFSLFTDLWLIQKMNMYNDNHQKSVSLKVSVSLDLYSINTEIKWISKYITFKNKVHCNID